MDIIRLERNAYDLGFHSLEESFDRIVDAYFDANGGHMTECDLADMVDDVEATEWWTMAHFMQGYYWGASIDDENELLGEQLLNDRLTN